MMFSKVSFVSLALLASNVDAAARPHFLVYETDSEMSNSMLVLQQSMDAGLHMAPIGTDSEFTGFASKWSVAREALKGLPEDAVTVVMDGRDTLLNVFKNHNNLEQIESDFMSAYASVVQDSPAGAVVMSAEPQCCVAALTHVRPGDYFDASTGRRNQRACNSGDEGCLWNGDGMTAPWIAFQNDLAVKADKSESGSIFLNAGVMAGRAADILNVLELADLKDGEDDQAVFTDLMYTFPEKIVLDYGEQIFGTAHWKVGMENNGCPFEADESEYGLTHTTSNTSPLILHFPGKFWQCFDETASKLGVDARVTASKRGVRGLQNYGPLNLPIFDDFQSGGGVGGAVQGAVNAVIAAFNNLLNLLGRGN